MTDTVDKVIIESETRGIEQSVGQLNQLGKSMDGVSVASQSVERSTTSIESRFSSLERRFGTTAGQASQFERIQEQVNRAVAQNPDLQNRANAVLAAAEQRYGGVSQALAKQRAELERLANVQKTVNSSTGVTGGSDSAARGADVAAYGQQLDSLRARFNPLFAAGQEYKATLADINRAQRVGAISQKEYADAIMSTKVAFTQQVNSLRGVTEQEEFFSRSARRAGAAGGEMAVGVGLARHELINLSRQAQDVVVSLQGGQGLGTVLLQQGSQIGDVFASSTGTVKGFFDQVVSGAAKILTPMRLVAGGVVALGAGAAYAGVSWSSAQKDIERSLIGIGARTGTTVADINNFASANASATGLSVDQARDVAIEFTKTGDITIGKIKGLGEAVRGFSVLTGQDATASAKALAQALSGDLVDGARELNKTYGFLNPEIEKSIQNFMKQGDRAGAAQVIVDAMAKDNLAAADSTGVLTKAWDLLGNAVSRAKIFIGKGVSDVATFHSGDVFGGQAQKASSAQADASVKEDNRIQTVGMDAVKSVVPQIEQLRTLEQALADVQRAKDAIGSTGPIKVIDDHGAEQILKNTIAATQEAMAETARYNEQVAAISQSWGNVGQKTALALDAVQTQIPVIEAVGGAAKMVAQYWADYASLVKQGRTEIEASEQAVKNMEATQAQVNSQAQETLFSLQNQAPVVAAVTAQQQMVAQAVATTNQLRHDGVSATLAQEIATQQVANAQAGATAAVLKQVEALKDSTAMIKAQADGTEARVAAEIAYKNAVASGADSLSASALSSATLDNYMARARASSSSFRDNLEGASSAAIQISQSIASAALASANMGSRLNDHSSDPNDTSGYGTFFDAANRMPSGGTLSGDPSQNVPVSFRNGGAGKRLDVGFTPAFMTDSGGSGPDSIDQRLNRIAASAYASGGVDAAIQAVMSQGQASSNPADSVAVMSQVKSLFDFKNSQTGDNQTQISNLNQEMAWLRSQPISIDRDNNIVSLQQSIDQLITSTNGLNSTNQDLLSPYYTQDPRTSHIGFRSQGMAAGGYVDVPGSPSANDNVTAIIPVASGERIYVDPQLAKRGLAGGGGSSSVVVNITNRITVGGGADRNEVGRTVYQATQNAVRQFQAASR